MLTGARVRGGVKERGRGRYEISYQPVTTGRNLFHIRVYMSSSNPSDLNTLINFCFNPFVAGISSEAVTADGCSPSNLVADDPRFRSQGLRVEHFIRPPVTITIDLCVPVAVSCILLCPDLPQGAELRVELSGAVKGNSVLHRLTAGPVMITSGSVLVARSTQCYRAMASVVTLANLVVHSSCSKDLAKCNHIESPLKLVNVLRQLRHLQLTVTRWTGAKPVSIKWLEVWGVVSTACSRKEAAIFDAKLKASMCSPSPCQQQPPKMYGKQSPDQTGIKHSSVSNSLPSTSHGTAAAPPTRKQDATSQDVPEQFLDELTFELMVLPMLLPSGHCVDQSTVDRLASNDALYGRPPTDPFTGIPFAESCKPEFCVQLKAHLDSYLHSTSAPQAHAYTLGSASEIEQFRLRNADRSSGGSLSSPPVSKRAKLQCREDVASEHPASIEPAATHHSSPSFLAQSRMPQQTVNSFDLEVGNSLDQALHQVLNSHTKSSKC